jgi:hypothetical protein
MCLDFLVTCGAIVRLIAGWLSSSITVGWRCGNPMSAANWRKYWTCWAHLPKARYSASQGLRATDVVSAEEWTTNGAERVPICPRHTDISRKRKQFTIQKLKIKLLLRKGLHYMWSQICMKSIESTMSEIGRKVRRRNGETELFISIRLLNCEKWVASPTAIVRWWHAVTCVLST